MGKIVVAGGVKGGVGKSLTAANVSVIAAEAGLAVVLVDLDTQETSVKFGSARAAYVEETGRQLPEITTLALKGKSIRDDLRRLADRYDLVVVDAGARDSASQRAALLVSDLLLLPHPPRGPDLWTLPDTVQMVEEVKAVAETLRPVAYVNRADRNDADNAEADEAFAAHEVLEVAPFRVGDRKAVPSAHLQGLAVHELKAKDRKAIEEMRRLAGWVFAETGLDKLIAERAAASAAKASTENVGV